MAKQQITGAKPSSEHDDSRVDSETKRGRNAAYKSDHDRHLP